MSREPTIIYSADNPQQAHLLRSLLEDEGIQAWVVNDAIQIAGGELPIGWRGAAKVVVGDDEAIAARRFAEAFDERTQRRVDEPAAGEPDIVEADSESARNIWPTCPTCGHSRSARCPICGESGGKFPTAYSVSADQNPQPRFLCPSCDECIDPEWYRLCARCGHDFGEGLEIKKKESPAIKIQLRVVVVLVVLLSLVAAIGAYFFWLFAGGKA